MKESLTGGNPSRGLGQGCSLVSKTHLRIAFLQFFRLFLLKAFFQPFLALDPLRPVRGDAFGAWPAASEETDNCMVSPELDSRARQKYLYWPKKERMTKGRLEAFSDGVIAIIITIMVLELKVPHSEDISSLRPLLPVFISYVLSFIYVAIYWNNHHHMMQAAASVNGKILWANVHLLFWLSLIPFATAWMGENHFSQWPAILYGFVLFMNAVAYSILARCLAKQHGKDSIISRALGKDKKGNISLGLYAFAVLIAFFNAWISFGIYVLVAIIWLIPDRRFEDKLHSGEAG